MGLQHNARELTPAWRWVSLAEVCVAIVVVLAHNVYHVIPNEVPILFVLAIASFRWREGKWGWHLYGRAGFTRRTLLVSLACLVLLVAKDPILAPVGRYFWPAPEHVSSVIAGARSLRAAALNLLLVWTFAAIGEEVGYRGYLLRRALDVFGPSRWGTAAALLIASVAFGFGHYYKGPAGVLQSTGSGLILGGAYLATRRLWAGSLAHGGIDTLAILSSYFGW